MCEIHKIDPGLPLKDLSPEKLAILLHGLDGEAVTFQYTTTAGRERTYEARFEGLVPFWSAATEKARPIGYGAMWNSI